MKILLSLLISFFVIFTVMGQSKKNQIEILSNRVDSLNSLLTTERIDNLKEVKDLETNISLLKSKLKTEEENLIEVFKELNIIKKELNDQKQIALGQKNELEQVEKELENYQKEYNNLEFLFIQLLLSKEKEKIEKTHEGTMINVETIYFGDLTGDNINEMIYYYILVNKNGGNSSSGTGLMIYQIENNEIKVYGNYHNYRIFTFDKVKDREIYIDFLKYAKGDAQCCPSLTEKNKIEIKRGDLY